MVVSLCKLCVLGVSVVALFFKYFSPQRHRGHGGSTETKASSQNQNYFFSSLLGKEARLVRSILFNKNGDTNWQVAWHQDLAIAVDKRVEIGGFTCWSKKNGTHHVQPAVQILEQMLNVRIHLDAANETNGALWVSPGSHHLGRIPANEAASTAKHLGTKLCAVAAGDMLLFRPLTLHASKKAVSNHPRRVIHLEFAGVALPPPLEWSKAA